MRVEMETFKGAKSTTGGGENPSRWCVHCGMPGLYKGGKKCYQWKDLSRAEAIENGLKFVTDVFQAAN
jgi:hypothetical protein